MSQLFTCLSLQARSAEVVYKTVGSLQMKLYIDYPDDMKASEKRPAIVFYFGGGWIDGNVVHFKPQADHFVKKGLITFVLTIEFKVDIRYRLLFAFLMRNPLFAI